mmetsp:Transcript_113917/g.254255  ORF Transcript_113917/g.254255 Transcript_113917/m.254255 type:complete len:88 (+) Transcript_113917:200-463(+)
MSPQSCSAAGDARSHLTTACASKDTAPARHGLGSVEDADRVVMQDCMLGRKSCNDGEALILADGVLGLGEPGGHAAGPGAWIFVFSA